MKDLSPRPDAPAQDGMNDGADSIEDGKRLIRLPTDKGASLAERIASHFYRLTWRTPLHNMRLKGKYPLKLLASPRDGVEGSRRSGKAILAGHFLLRGQKLAIEGLDFSSPAPGSTLGTPAMSDYVHGFRWLRDLGQAGPREQTSPIAETILRAWLKAHAEKPSEPAWGPEQAGWRLMFWAAYAPLILSSNDLVYRSLVLNCFARTARHLDRGADKAPAGIARIVACCGVVTAGLLLPGGAPRKSFGEAGLKRAIEHGFYSDGGAISRSPLAQMRGVEALSMVKAAYDAVRAEVPTFLTETLNRTVAALLGITHGDGGLGSWQGGSAFSADQVRAIISASGVRTRPLRQARDWGYQRISAGSTVLLVDAAPPPVAQLAEAGCASTGAIEISDGEDRLIVNCGGAIFTGTTIAPELARGLRTTAAHSTLTLDDSNSTAILPDGTLGRGVSEVELHRQELDNGSRIELSHDGYVRRYGYIHRRLIHISNDGRDIRGEDMLLPAQQRKRPANAPYVLRFHLAPYVDVSLTADGQGALMRIDMGALWQFRCNAGALGIEDSLWVDGDGRPHATKQIVVSAAAEPGGTSLGWLLKRVG